MKATFNKIDDPAGNAHASLGAVCLRSLFSDWIDVLRTDWFPLLWPRADSE